MPALSLALSPPALQRLHDSLACLAKFSEYITLEASRSRLSLTALNSSKSAHGAVNLLGGRFFDTYHFVGSTGPAGADARFSCRVQTKALLAVFRERYLETKDKGTAIEKCEVTLGDKPLRGECRLHVRFICKHGVVKTYKLTYEDAEVLNAVFDKTTANNRWKINSKLLREYMEHFGPKAEQLDISGEGVQATLTSYTEKLMDGTEILKQPLHTAVTMDTAEYEEFSVEEGLHITINLKDFKAVIHHADSLNAVVSVYYTDPGRPLQIQYEGDGMDCEFTLMTVGARSGQPLARPIPRAPASQTIRIPPQSQQAIRNPTPREQREEQEDTHMADLASQAPPPKPMVPVQEPSAVVVNQINQDGAELSLFFEGTQDEEGNENEANEAEDVLGWDVDMDHSARTGPILTQNKPAKKGQGHEGEYDDDDEDFSEEERRVVGPTQVSQVPGLFD
ncbi:DNA repair protein RAD9 [Peziza echinospora]|nr:DNA repair protein RAD9 [Peziza echinospora]